MIRWKLMELTDIHRGTVVYVEFQCLATPLPTIFIPCEVLDIKRNDSNPDIGRVEIVPISGDSTCLWINSNKIYSKSW